MKLARTAMRTVIAGLAAMTVAGIHSYAEAQTKPPNIVMLMTDDTGWNDFGAYSGGGCRARPSDAECRPDCR